MSKQLGRPFCHFGRKMSYGQLLFLVLKTYKVPVNWNPPRIDPPPPLPCQTHRSRLLISLPHLDHVSTDDSKLDRAIIRYYRELHDTTKFEIAALCMRGEGTDQSGAG